MISLKLKSCLIVCNGHFTKKELNSFTKLNKPRKVIDIIACDGASDFLRRCNVIPDVIIGDLDSVNPQTLKYYCKKSSGDDKRNKHVEYIK